MNPKLRFSEFGDDLPWRTCLIGDILSVLHGRDYRDLPEGDIPVLATGGQIASVAKPICTWPCVLIGRKGTINRPQFMNEPFWSVDTLYYSKPKKDQDPKFQYYLFQTIDWMKFNEASGVPSLSSSTIHRIEISVPGIREQQKIADFFSALDKKIALAERTLHLFQLKKKKTLQVIFSNRESNQWDTHCLGDLLRFQNGINADRDAFGSGVKLISVSEILDSKPICYDTVRSSVDVDEKTLEKFSVTYGDVLFQRSSETLEEAGTANIYVDEERPCVFGGFVIRGKRVAEYNPIFLNEALCMPFVRRQMKMFAQGAQHINIGQDSLSKVIVRLPSIAEQDRYSEMISTFDSKICLLERKIQTLKKLKKAFLQKMFV